MAAAQDYWTALDAGDRSRAQQTVGALLAGGWDNDRVIAELVVPSQEMIGDLWLRGERTVAQEHAATGVNEAIVHLLISRLSPTPPQAPVILVACLPVTGTPSRRCSSLAGSGARRHGVRRVGRRGDPPAGHSADPDLDAPYAEHRIAGRGRGLARPLPVRHLRRGDEGARRAAPGPRTGAGRARPSRPRLHRRCDRDGRRGHHGRGPRLVGCRAPPPRCRPGPGRGGVGPAGRSAQQPSRRWGAAGFVSPPPRGRLRLAGRGVRAARPGDRCPALGPGSSRSWRSPRPAARAVAAARPG